MSAANEKPDGSHNRGRWVTDSVYRDRSHYCYSVHRPHTKSASLPTLLPVHRTSLLIAKTRTSYHLYSAYASYHLPFKLLVCSYSDMRQAACILPTQFICASHNKHPLFPTQHSPNDLSYSSTLCFLWGTNSILVHKVDWRSNSKGLPLSVMEKNRGGVRGRVQLRLHKTRHGFKPVPTYVHPNFTRSIDVSSIFMDSKMSFILNIQVSRDATPFQLVNNKRYFEGAQWLRNIAEDLYLRDNLRDRMYFHHISPGAFYRCSLREPILSFTYNRM